jgi:isoleucyl-tRNA synthetase
LYEVGIRLLQLYAPFVPFVAEAIYQQVYATQLVLSIHQTQFEYHQTPFVFQKSQQQVSVLIQLVTSVRKLKTGLQLSLKTPIELLTMYSADSEYVRFLQAHTVMIKGVTQAVNLRIVDQDIAGVDSMHVDENGLMHAVLYTKKE